MRKHAHVLGLVLLSIGLAAVAGPRERLTDSNAELCDEKQQVCLRGTLSYRSNPRLLELRARVLKASGPGLLRIRVVGENLDGFTRRTTMEIQIRGNYSEIVNHRLITDHPDVDDWRLEKIFFSPDDAS